MKTVIGIETYNPLTLNEDCKCTPVLPGTLNIFLNPLASIPGNIIKLNELDLDVMDRKYERFFIEDLGELGDWVLCIGEDDLGVGSVNFRFGYTWGDIKVFDGAEYFAQHSDMQYHAQEGWRIRVKFDKTDWILAKPGYYRSDDGKKILWREAEDAE